MVAYFLWTTLAFYGSEATAKLFHYTGCTDTQVVQVYRIPVSGADRKLRLARSGCREISRAPVGREAMVVIVTTLGDGQASKTAWRFDNNGCATHARCL